MNTQTANARPTVTLDETGTALTVTHDGVEMPADYTFAAVNDFVHTHGRHFEELQWLALGMASHIESLMLQLVAANLARREAQLETQTAIEARNRAGVEIRREMAEHLAGRKQDARIADLERKAPLHDQIMRACGELPDLWEITIHLEKGAGTVSLLDACGNEVEVAFDHESMTEDLKDAIDHAKSSAGRDLLDDQIGGAA